MLLSKLNIINRLKKGNHILPLIFLLGLYTLTRIYFEIVGVRMANFDCLSQNFAKDLMQNHLLESVFYDHYQPPMVNLIPGLFVKFFGDRYWVMATAFYDILSTLIIIELYFIFHFLQIRKWIGIVIISLLILNPSFLYYEKMLFYHHPVVFLFSTAVLCLLAFIRYQKTYWLHILFFSLCFIAYYRTSFTVYWMAACVLIIGWLLKNWKDTFKAALIPFVLVVGMYLKNLLVFGFWGSSTISGVNMWILTHFTTQEVKETMIRDNKVSPLFARGLWVNNVNDFKPYLKDTVIPEKLKNISVLNSGYGNTTKSSQHFYMIEINRQIEVDSKKIILESPVTMLKVFVYGMYVYFYPTGDYVLNNGNLAANRTLNTWYNRLILWQLNPPANDWDGFFLPWPEKATGKMSFEELFTSMKFGKVSFTSVLFYIFLLIWGVSFLLSVFRKTELSQMDKIKVFLLFQMAYIFALYTLFTTIENNRLRNETMTLSVILIGIISNEAYNFYLKKKPKNEVSE